MLSAAIRVRGQVQGVGFRPFVWQLARARGIAGEVLNDPEGVLIRATGPDLEGFAQALRDAAPPLARVDAIEMTPHAFAEPPRAFVIARSEGQGAETRITPDAATCDACLADLRGDDRRRAGYAFNNCTHCGPRFTIIAGLPYDRARTSMAGFAMCPACAAEYADPADRRFHAQPVACADCGPRLWYETGQGAIPGDPVALAVQCLRAGGIVAIKGLGGFHICCDATRPDALRALRQRKRRPSKPLALMLRHDRLADYAEVSPAARALLRDPAAPVVLMPRRPGVLPDSVAPGMAELGVMLPYTPLHHLLTDAMGGGPLVMTSGNLSGAPQVIGNAEAREVLAGLVDGFVMHDREILRRLDDSVERPTPQGPMRLRRARGRVPETLPLPPGFADAPQVVAFGGHLKSAICLIKNGQALLSHHLGDLDDALTWDEFLKADADYADLFRHRPDIFACDLHSGYLSSQHAVARAGHARVAEVQHHHAHLAACLAENLWPRDGGPVAGIVLDGLGLGDDGTIWGGELLVGDYAGFVRAAHLTQVPLVGGDMAQRAPWRNALMRLDEAGMGDWADTAFGAQPLAQVRQAAAAGINAPPSSSAGRLFDAVAAVLGLAPDTISFEGEAAMRLEALAAAVPDHDATARAYPFQRDGAAISPVPMLRALLADRAAEVAPGLISARFHAGLAAAFATAARAEVAAGRARAVALSGGCFQNPVLLRMTLAALGDVPAMVHTRVPANDGGLALGQAVIAAARR